MILHCAMQRKTVSRDITTSRHSDRLVHLIFGYINANCRLLQVCGSNNNSICEELMNNIIIMKLMQFDVMQCGRMLYNRLSLEATRRYAKLRCDLISIDSQMNLGASDQR